MAIPPIGRDPIQPPNYAAGPRRDQTGKVEGVDRVDGVGGQKDQKSDRDQQDGREQQGRRQGSEDEPMIDELA